MESICEWKHLIREPREQSSNCFVNLWTKEELLFLRSCAIHEVGFGLAVFWVGYGRPAGNGSAQREDKPKQTNPTNEWSRRQPPIAQLIHSSLNWLSNGINEINEMNQSMEKNGINKRATKQQQLRGKPKEKTNKSFFVKIDLWLNSCGEGWLFFSWISGLWAGTAPLRSRPPFRQFHNCLHFTCFALINVAPAKREPATCCSSIKLTCL